MLRIRTGNRSLRLLSCACCHAARLLGVVVLASLLSAALPFVAVASPAFPQQADRQGGEAGEEIERRNELALIIAGTYEDEENRFTTGFEYSRRLHQYVGVAGVVEYLEDGTWVYVFPILLYPVGGLKLVAGPGFEREEGENSFLIRVGVGYGIEFTERFSLQPSLDVDFIGRDAALVYGLTLGVSF